MIRLGFVGFGRMGITHFAVLNSHPSVEVSGVVDSSSIMRGLAASYLQKKVYSSHQEMCRETQLDGLVISTPNDSHSELIEFAIEHGLHVFVEKPFVMDRSAGERILNLLDGKELVTQVGYVNRFNEVFQEVKSILDDSLLGEVVNFRSEMYGRTVLKESSGMWRGKKEAGGGVLYDLGSHALDLAVFLIGKPDRVCGSVMQSIYSSEVEDILCSTLIYDKGITGSVRVNWSDESCRKAGNLIEVIGKKGKIIAGRYGFKLYLREQNGSRNFETGWNHRNITEIAGPVRYYLRGNEFTNQLDHFISCIEARSPETICTLKDAFITDCLMEDIRNDALGCGVSKVDGLPNYFIKTGKPRARGLWSWLKRLFGKERC